MQASDTPEHKKGQKKSANVLKLPCASEIELSRSVSAVRKAAITDCALRWETSSGYKNWFQGN